MYSGRCQGVTVNGLKGLACKQTGAVGRRYRYAVCSTATPVPLGATSHAESVSAEALFLSDLVVGGDGAVYFTDDRNNAVFVVDRNYHAAVFASRPQLSGPDGILFDRGSPSWARSSATSASAHGFGKAALPPLCAYREVSALELPRAAMFLDGYVRDEGDLLMTSWVSGKVLRSGRSRTDLVIARKMCDWRRDLRSRDF
jgi:hypothetical protein